MKEKPKEFVVYRIYHVDTGKSYIGIAVDYERRMKEHFSSKNNYYIHNAIQKHGKDKFATEIIFECNSWDEAKKEEIDYIKMFDTMLPNGYNMTEGGDGNLGRIPNAKTRKKMSEWQRNRPPATEKTRKKMSEAQQNRSKETRKRMSESSRVLSKDQVLEIRKMLLDRIIYKIIAKKFNVVISTIGSIKQNKHYADIQLPKQET